MDHHEDAGEVKDSRQNGCDGNGNIGNCRNFAHKERGGAHDRRHDLTACGSGCFDGCGKFRLIADAFHDRDGNASAADGIGDRAAGIHALKCRRNDGDLSRSARRITGNGIGKVNEKAADTGLFKKCAEDDKEHDER